LAYLALKRMVELVLLCGRSSDGKEDFLAWLSWLAGCSLAALVGVRGETCDAGLAGIAAWSAANGRTRTP
jgi:hypothetical protein